MTTTKRITRATLKSFINKNRDNLLVLVSSRFDGMTDGCESTGNRTFSPALESERPSDHDMGVQGIWFVGGGRDSFDAFDDGSHVGFEVYNCCGCFKVAVAK